MTRYFIFPLIILSALLGSALRMDAQALRFDFGPDAVEAGYTAVTPQTLYSEALGYGFEPGPSLSGVTRKKGTALTRDYITAAEPFRFSVRLPEGNYRVTLTLGDTQGSSCTTVKSEVRRLMVESLQTAKGETRKVSFNVNVRTPQLSSGNTIKLNSREWDAASGTVKTYTWDDKLTLQFYDSAPAVCAVEIEAAAEDVVTVYVIGDSTVTDQPSGGTWGQYLPRWFDDHVTVANHAESGMTIKGFRFMRHWDKIMESCKPGDYLLIQLGTNDEKRSGHDAMWPQEDLAGDWVRTHADPEKDYVWGLATMALEAKRHGMIPVIVSPMTKIDRRTATSTELMTPYGINARRGAELGECAYIDLWSMSRQIVSALGQNALAAYADGTHTDNFGAYLYALCITRGIREQNLPLKDYLLPETPAFDPAHPHPVLSAFTCPVEPRRAPQRPPVPQRNGQTEFGPL